MQSLEGARNIVTSLRKAQITAAASGGVEGGPRISKAIARFCTQAAQYFPNSIFSHISTENSAQIPLFPGFYRESVLVKLHRWMPGEPGSWYVTRSNTGHKKRIIV